MAPPTRTSTPAQRAASLATAPATRSRKPSVNTATPAPVSKAAARPLWSSHKINTAEPPRVHVVAPATKRKASGERSEVTGDAEPVVDFEKRGVDSYDPTREPIKAYLRIRPVPLTATDASNYIQLINPTEVLMVPPRDHRLNPSNGTSFFGTPLLRSNLLPTLGATEQLGTVYKFTQVFLPSVSSPLTPPPAADSQAAFFKTTTLPLIHDFLGGENCLLFAYGPSGSGKTWTVQGGEGESSGLLPRVMDVVWRSLEGRESKSLLRPARLAGVEMTPPAAVRSSNVLGGNKRGPMSSTPTKSTGLGVGGSMLDDILRKSFNEKAEEAFETVPVDDDFEYSIWVSYAEIYNEKIYDLLESPVPVPSSSGSSTHSIIKTGLGILSVGGAKAKALSMKGFQTVKRNALSLKHDKNAGNKYVADLKELRVHSSEEARSILDRGQTNRRVFSTLANRVSSRSHSVFTIKVIKIRKGADPEDTSAASTSRFSIVDLAGSERVVNTQTTGERLKEAGNINKSLMVLGQCMEVLRKNQEREKGRKPAIVPFRHSKLTELFQSFFVGDGKAVMIVNVNPYDTGFDENSHVMKFSAVAKGIMTVKNNLPAINSLVLPCTPAPKGMRVVRLSMIDGGEEEDIIYEEEDAESDVDEEQDEFVNALLEELSTMRTTLFQAQMQTVLSESLAKSATVQIYEQKLLDMERYYQDRMREEAHEAEVKLNAKLDILTRLQAARKNVPRTPATPSTNYDDSDEEEEEEEEEEDESFDKSVVEKMLLDGTTPLDRSMTLEDEVESPTAFAKGRNSDQVLVESPLNVKALRVVEDSTEEEEEEEEEEEVEEEEEEEEEVEEDDSLPVVDSSFDVSLSASDDYMEDEDPSSDDYEPAPTPPRTTVSRKSIGSVRSTKAKKVILPEIDYEEVMELQTRVSRVSLGAEGDENEGEEEDDIVPVLKVKKPKRILGKHTVKDVEDIDSFADANASVIVVKKSASSRSILTTSHSVKSLNRR